MKKLFTALLFAALTTSPLAAQQPPTVDQPKITVTGEALVYAKPDKVILNFGIETRDTQLLVAKRKNAEIWKKAAAAIKESGVPDKDVQTDYLSIEPRYKDFTTRRADRLRDPQHVRRDVGRSGEGGDADLQDAGSRRESCQRRRVPDHPIQAATGNRPASWRSRRPRKRRRRWRPCWDAPSANRWRSTRPAAAGPGTSPVGPAGATGGLRECRRT